MKFKTLDTVVLDRDLPEYRLRRGDLGAVVHVHDDDALDIEFVTANGSTVALVTVRAEAVRAVSAQDLVTVRPMDEAH